MCLNHQWDFDHLCFFIRFNPDVSLILLCSELSIHQKQARKFIFVNYSNSRRLEKYHGKVVGLDPLDYHAPFPSLFIIHEIQVRGFHPFQSIALDVPDSLPWQDWIELDMLKLDGTGLFNRNSNPLAARGTNTTLQPFTQPQMAGVGSASSGKSTLPLPDADHIAKILEVMYTLPSWKACVMEGTSWTGTAEENIQKYRDVIGMIDI